MAALAAVDEDEALAIEVDDDEEVGTKRYDVRNDTKMPINRFMELANITSTNLDVP
jgi:hypothetical protein